MITYEGYLTQDKLLDILNQLPEFKLIGKEVQVAFKNRKRWDFLFEVNGKQIVVEFDGDAHYRDSLRIKSDTEKNEIAFQTNLKVVRIPYWLQLTTKTFTHLFGFAPSKEISNNFPHGFIVTKVFPASSCSLGIKRYSKELSLLPKEIKEEILFSLEDRVKEYGKEYVYFT